VQDAKVRFRPDRHDDEITGPALQAINESGRPGGCIFAMKADVQGGRRLRALLSPGVGIGLQSMIHVNGSHRVRPADSASGMQQHD